MRGALGGCPGRLVERKETIVHPVLQGHFSCTTLIEYCQYHGVAKTSNGVHGTTRCRVHVGHRGSVRSHGQEETKKG